ncbi:hypothetical protein CLV24_1149 [Pontibacter ummariensis]|uniref:Uncharacterized protein n=1 Tax=Pontibacter ummariensis TaxID=1610492 RepID=A0A239HJJ5_9BACT|nr:hypothetical protein [Pontibacter ummariensis]PRY10281.1 hypothetical protein CLV24_1149 [Pontibacter ummariensis]SNS81315.1 hypothetical protein SAMN06296052_1149 [Pontibacter ummariensis]
MARIQLAKVCGTASQNPGITRRHYWDTVARTEVMLEEAQGSTCSNEVLPKGTLVDSWYEGSTLVEVKTVWDGTGRAPRAGGYTEQIRTENAGGGGETVCGLKIDDVIVSGTGSEYTITVIISGYSGAVEYSLNQFVDVQDSNVFTGLQPGQYIAYARAK